MDHMPTYITNRNMTYNTRRLKAGDEFKTSRRDGDLLVKLGKAQYVPNALARSAFVPPPPPVVRQPTTPTPPVPAAIVTPESEASESTPSTDTLAAVRAEYEAAVGKRAFHGWDEAELRRRIVEHQDAGSS
jgi:hypothetical protein